MVRDRFRTNGGAGYVLRYPWLDYLKKYAWEKGQ
jgi:hypothetical protein